MLYGHESWPANKDNLIRPKINDARMLRCMYNVRQKNKISATVLTDTLQVNITTESLQNGTFTMVLSQKIEKSSWLGKCKRFEVGRSLARERPRKTRS